MDDPILDDGLTSVGDEEDNMNRWAINIDQALSFYNAIDISFEPPSSKKCIYKVPQQLMNNKNKEAYKPRMVFSGPYHSMGDHQNAGAIKRKKRHAFLHFLKESGKGVMLYVNALNPEVEDLNDAYDELDQRPYARNHLNKFIKTMVRDGCFILEILRVCDEDYHFPHRYDTNDPIFGDNGILNQIPAIRRDMLLVENQVPLRVLQILAKVQSGEDDTKILNDLISRILMFCGLSTQSIPNDERTTCLHMLDVFRKACLVTPTSREGPQYNRTYGALLSATELQEAGIRFKISKTKSLKDISFKNYTLYCPQIKVDHNTESLFLNLMAFEKMHPGAKKDVTSYVYFMSTLMKSGADTRLLCELEIVRNKFRTEDDVAQLFSSMIKDFPLEHESWITRVYFEVSTALRNPIRKKLNAWKFDLWKNYLKSPWAIVSVIAAIILFTLTGVQTVYTVLSYDYQKGQGNNSTHS